MCVIKWTKFTIAAIAAGTTLAFIPLPPAGTPALAATPTPATPRVACHAYARKNTVRVSAVLYRQDNITPTIEVVEQISIDRADGEMTVGPAGRVTSSIAGVCTKDTLLANGLDPREANKILKRSRAL